MQPFRLTHWDRVTNICLEYGTIVGSYNVLSPGRWQDIILTNATRLFTGSLATQFFEILIKLHTFSFKKMHLILLSAKWRPFCLAFNVLNGVLCDANAKWRHRVHRYQVYVIHESRTTCAPYSSIKWKRIVYFAISDRFLPIIDMH